MRQVGSTTYSLIRLDGLDQLREWQPGVSMIVMSGRRKGARGIENLTLRRV